MTLPFPIKPTRRAILEIAEFTDEAGATPTIKPGLMFVPPSHARALDPENAVVEGIRGAGKSFWWAALNSKPHRQFVATAFPESRIDDKIIVSQGYGNAPSIDKYPGKDTLESLLAAHDPRRIWQTVIASQLSFPSPFPLKATWLERVKWVNDNPEQYERFLFSVDAELVSKQETRLIIFDGLDRLAASWPGIRPPARALFQLALDLRSTRKIRLKLFVRPDMLQDSEILQFPDSSKLISRKVSLAWRRIDLYALLFQRLGNSTDGQSFRTHSRDNFSIKWNKDPSGQSWILPRNVQIGEVIQKRIFHAISGPTMTADPKSVKRGFPYTWLVNHLMDAYEQASPRSFFAALKSAANEDNPDGWSFPLNYRAIQNGVQEASRIRVAELIGEDYPWIGPVMDPLKKNLTVPCHQDDIYFFWDQATTLSSLQKSIADEKEAVKLPPQKLEEGLEGLLEDLTRLGIFQKQPGGRIQVPDVYRIAFGLGRMGGVKPLK